MKEKIIVCDICDARIFENEGRTKCKIQVENISSEYYDRIFATKWTRLDICPKCYKDMTSWIKLHH